MRHRKKIKKLGRTASHRKAMLRNMGSSLLEHHQIKTTLAKAKVAQGYVEKLITFGKVDTVHSRRQAFKLLQNRDLVKILFDDIASSFADRTGGYTRVIKLGKRRGDNAELAVLQLVGFEEMVVDDGPQKKNNKSAKPKVSKAPKKAETVKEPEEVKEETPAEDADETKSEVEAPKKDTASSDEADKEKK